MKVKTKYEVIRWINFYTDIYPFDASDEAMKYDFEFIVGVYFPYCFQKICDKHFKNIGILDTSAEVIADIFAAGCISDDDYNGKIEFSVRVTKKPSKSQKELLLNALMKTLEAIKEAIKEAPYDWEDTATYSNWIIVFDKQIDGL